MLSFPYHATFLHKMLIPRHTRTELARVPLIASALLGISLCSAVSAASPSGGLRSGRENVAAVDFLETLRRAGPGQTVSLKDATVKGPLHLTSAGLDSIGAAIRLRNVTFEDPVTFDRLVFTGPVRITKSTFERGISMLDGRFEQKVSFTKSSFGGHATFKRTHFSQAARFVDIVSNGMMSFSGAVFGETTDFTRAQFLQPAYFDQAAFSNTTSFQDVTFGLESSFKETHWSNDVDFAGTRFGAQTLFRYARFSGIATFDRSRFRGEVFFDKARFERPVSFREITFVRLASFTRAIFIDDADFAHCRFKKEADFSDVDFHAPVHLNAYFGRDLILRHATGPVADLRPTPKDPATESADSTFSDTARVYLHNADFGRMLFDWSQLSGRLASADSANTGTLEATYGAVRRHLKNLGLAEDARSAHREWMEWRRQALPPWSAERMWLEVFSATTRYGTDPGRLLWWALAVILLFAFIFNRQSPSGPEGFLPCLYMSLCAFTRLSLPRQPVGQTRLWIAVEAVIGWLFAVGFIAICVNLLSS